MLQPILMTAVEPALWMNSGGPMSRTRTERIRSSLLGRDDGPVRCPRRLTLALDFGRRDPRTVVTKLLAQRRLSDPEELRLLYVDIPGPMLCRADETVRPRVVSASEPDYVLRDAFLLGLCTSVFYDPSRPVLWTNASLTRRLELFETTGFYA